MDILETKIKNRIDVLKAELKKFVDDANTSISAYNVAIKELEKLIEPEETKEEHPKE